MMDRLMEAPDRLNGESVYVVGSRVIVLQAESKLEFKKFCKSLEVSATKEHSGSKIKTIHN